MTPEEVALYLNQIGDICVAEGDRDTASKTEAKRLVQRLLEEVRKRRVKTEAKRLVQCLLEEVRKRCG